MQIRTHIIDVQALGPGDMRRVNAGMGTSVNIFMVDKNRDAAIVRITSLGCATEQTSYRGPDIRFIDKKDSNINR